MQKKKLMVFFVVLSFLNKIISLVFIFLITVYQKVVSVHLPASCRFTPSCSEYAKQVYKKYTIGKASVLTVKRLLRCHPFSPGGYDPVP